MNEDSLSIGLIEMPLPAYKALVGSDSNSEDVQILEDLMNSAEMSPANLEPWEFVWKAIYESMVNPGEDVCGINKIINSSVIVIYYPNEKTFDIKIAVNSKPVKGIILEDPPECIQILAVIKDGKYANFERQTAVVIKERMGRLLEDDDHNIGS